MIVAAHGLASAMRTAFLLPQRGRILDADQHLAFLFNVIHALHTPGFSQRQYLLKHSFWYHIPHQKTPLPPFYQLKTSTKQKY